MSWGHLTSSDLLRWRRNGNKPVLEPSEPYDREGVLTGCLFPSGPYGEKDQLSAIYSSACHLPFHWTSPYPHGSAGLALASSKDEGITWSRATEDLILREELPDVGRDRLS
jgi:beta-fructofuranosidase